MSVLEELTGPDLVFTDLESRNARSVLRELAENLAEQGRVEDPELLETRLLEREELGSTGLGDGVAVPHCKMEGVRDVIVAIGIASHGVDFGAVDGRPVKIFFLVVSPSESPAAHLQSLAAISRWVKEDRHLERLLEADDAHEIYELVRKAS